MVNGVSKKSISKLWILCYAHSVMHDQSLNNAEAENWTRENPHWILLARLVAVGIVVFIVWSIFFKEPIYTDYELRNLPYQEIQPESPCGHPLCN